MGRPIESVPIVLAYNKRDLPDVLSMEELDREFNPHWFPALPTSASLGKGVFETLDAIVRLALDDLRQRRVIPADVQVPPDGIVMERLSEVRAAVPTPMVEPTRVVSEEPPRSASMTMPAVVTTDVRSTPVYPLTTPGSGVRIAPAASIAGAISSGGSVGLAATLPPVAREDAPPRQAPGSSSTLTAIRRASLLAPLFTTAEDQETVRTIEEAMSESILPRAALLIEALLVRVLERSARVLGREGAAPESIAWVLQLPPERYAKLRTAAQRARRGGEISRRDVLEAYVLVAMAQIAADAAVH
jgi:hypothetical protein